MDDKDNKATDKPIDVKNQDAADHDEENIDGLDDILEGMDNKLNLTADDKDDQGISAPCLLSPHIYSKIIRYIYTRAREGV